MALPPRFNSNDPPLVADYAEMARLKVSSPQWVSQFLAFPAPAEITNHLGKARADVRKRAMAALSQVLNARFLPEDTSKHLIPLTSWAVLYEDWRDHGKSDVFFTRFQKEHYLVQLAETPNHVVVMVRDLGAKRAEDLNGALRRSYGYADLLFNEHLKPLGVESFRMFRTSTLPLSVYGYFPPKVEALTGQEKSQDVLTSGGTPNESSSSARASALRFFSDGDFTAFLVPKPFLNGELANPFEPRFDSASARREGAVPDWLRSAPPSTAGGPTGEQLRLQEMAEYLGGHFHDPDWKRLSEQVPVSEFEQVFRELSQEQKLAILERRQSDEYYTSGTRAYLEKNYDAALVYWTRLLWVDPQNPRAAVLLQLAIRAKTREAFANNPDKARSDKLVAAANDALSHQQAVLTMQMEQKQQEVVRNRAVEDFRTRALSFMKEGNYADSAREWDRILDIEPGNATALFFKDICEGKLKGAAKPRP